MQKTGNRLVDFATEHRLTEHRIPMRDATVLRVLTAGEPGAPRLLCLHGFPQNAAEWRRVIGLVRDRFFVIAPDLRGYAESSLSATGRYDIETLASDVIELCGEPELGSGPVHLVAHDWGGAIGWHALGRRPELFARHVCVQGPHLGAYVSALRSDAKQRMGSWYTAMFQLPFAEYALSRNGAAVLANALRSSSAPGTFSDEDLELYLGPLADPKRMRAALSYYREAARRIATLGKRFFDTPMIDVPTTFVWGTRDAAIRKIVRDITIERYCPSARVVELAGVSHWVPDEAPQAVADALIAGL